MDAGTIDQEIELITQQIKELDASERRWCPQRPTKKQARFLAIDAFEALYGGAAGGGKSSALLMDALQGADEERYAAIIFRRTYTDLALPGALMDRAAEWLHPTGAKWSERHKKWTIPSSGTTVSFGFLESEADKYRYQSSEFQRAYFDEITQFLESQFRYFLSRVRRVTGSTSRLRVRCATNPGGIGHDWVKARYVDPGDPSRPFLPATLDDNPHLDAVSYRGALALLDPTTRSQLEKGVWVREQGGLLYRYEPANLISQPPPVELAYILGVDLGARQDEPTTGFVVVGWHENLAGTFTIEAWKEAGLTPADIAERIKQTTARFTPTIEVVVDEGALGKGYGEEFRRRYKLPVKPAEKSNKLGYRKLLNGALKNLELMLITAGCQPLIDEIDNLPWDARGLDAEKGFPTHLSDAWLYAWRASRAYSAKPPKQEQPKPGTEEWNKSEEERMEREDEERMGENMTRKWWQR